MSEDHHPPSNDPRPPSAEEDPTLRLPGRVAGLAPGRELAQRYRVVRRLGTGGMGEVWQAYDLKLCVDVVLKAVHPFLMRDPERIEMLRREVRAARRVVSPHVCRLYDLVEIDGHELVSMEFVDGRTLLDALRDRGPLALEEAQDVASQLLTGLQAIHESELIHRDIKPENIMLTRAGRVVIMDFGLARELADPSRTVSGTPAYMAPEQLRGEELDARADLFSAGIVLAEMVSPEGVQNAENRRRVWEGMRSRPCRPPDSPWARVIERAVAFDPADRFETARALLRGLEEVTVRSRDGEGARPYPGLDSFTEGDEEYFFGREAEIEQMWRRLEGPPRLLALVGPSGSGKTSFLRAGLIPAASEGWGILRCTPGSSPMAALRSALTGELAGDTRVLRSLVEEPDDPAVLIRAFNAWRGRHDHVLLIVDQFEELFTLNAPEVQERFSSLVGSLPLAADVRVLLSLRDDFLMHCNTHPRLRPLFSELTPLAPLSGEALRRALVRPAARCGARFESPELVEAMLEEVEGRRGALPMLAFAAAALWEGRQRNTGTLTYRAYEEFGGVAGSLARHAEATLDRIGRDRHVIVREIFRNLVTAEGTRAIREVEELLSVFRDRGTAKLVLDELIEARLLTSFEDPAPAGAADPSAHVEIIHESLLSHWPRLRRWRTQDADGAQLRDELRQAAQRWHQRGQPRDLLWTGTSYREFELWRERYPGSLSELEDQFADAMSTLARHRRQRRIMATVASFLTLVVILLIVLGSWQQSRLAQREAEREARQAQADLLLSLGARALEGRRDATEALAYATRSLEFVDSEDARRFALRVLWTAPPALELRTFDMDRWPVFSPDGRHLAIPGHQEVVRVWSEDDPHPQLLLPGNAPGNPQGPNWAAWAAHDLLVTGHPFAMRKAHLWSVPEGQRLRTIDLGGRSRFWAGGRQLFAEVLAPSSEPSTLRLRAWTLPDAEGRDLARPPASLREPWGSSAFVLDGRGWLYQEEGRVHLRSLAGGSRGEDTVLGRHEASVVEIWPLSAARPRAYSADEEGGIQVWDFGREKARRILSAVAPDPPSGLRRPDPTLRWAVNEPALKGELRIWRLASWPRTRPVVLGRRGDWLGSTASFHPDGEWLVASRALDERVAFWPLPRAHPIVVDGYAQHDRPVEFSQDGRWLATAWEGDELRLWPLPPDGSREEKALASGGEFPLWTDIAFDPRGRYLFVVGNRDQARVVPLDGSPPRRLEGFSDETILAAAAVSPSGRLVATAFGSGRGSRTLRVWDLDTGELRLLDLPELAQTLQYEEGTAVRDLAFTSETTLYTAGVGGIHRWDLREGEHELVLATPPGNRTRMSVAPEAGRALVTTRGASSRTSRESESASQAWVLDLETQATRPLEPSYAAEALALGRGGAILATGDASGHLRVGRVEGGEAHLLIGHEGSIQSVDISPDGRHVATAGQDNTLRLWPIPDLSEPPLHALPHEELLEILRSLTNVRVVTDSREPETWTTELDTFPGWEEIPRWQTWTRSESEQEP